MLEHEVPKVNGIPNARDSSGGAGTKANGVFSEDDTVEHVDLEEEKAAESNTTPEKNEEQEETPEKAPSVEKKPVFSPHTQLLKTEAGINGNKIKRKRDSAGDIAQSMDKFTEVYASMGMNMLQLQRDIAKDKADRDIKLAELEMKYRQQQSGNGNA
ncbi:hypothetical protein KFL_015810010 [Klebsormidium nitens]|uniref:Uncharacterized protein n=1 Tax=Klebsormidium nitens TaxID=105231 RepID=A0A1Y1IX55_KLENI|nr:hypothetical protein KFL_015810010 [Klebsormidium nitens]|eukprot:GAQ93496.1 hypothetical protein KFL_015810010 [Klebsormidium nitens]